MATIFDDLTDKYLAFYRPKKKKGRASSRAAVRPLRLAFDILTRPENLQLTDDELTIAIAASIQKLVDQCHAGTAEGFAVSVGSRERQLIIEFAKYFVAVFFREKNLGRREAFVGNKAALYLNTCEFIVAGR